ncbi:oleate hydratase [Actinophytocola xinjiangensis]|uniref:oleate hydratase n=1 Tax=Actinophytocola xinjiangensis TaxID=485602 RepID=UPI000AAE978E|nr:oleate hydratase [Actinophytocola xinjiangensis]
MRFIHHIGGLPDFSALKFTKYNQYESLVLPLYTWLLEQGVVFHFSTTVTDVDFDLSPRRKQATRFTWTRDGVPGIVTVTDSNWLMSWTVNRQPHFKQQKPTEIVVWLYSLFVDRPGNHVPKAMRDCTGEEITQEWLYHLGVPVEDIPELAATGAKTVPVMMPYVTSFFMPRKAGDRPDVVPPGAVNFAFIGQFAETSRDCIFTTEYSVRTPMEAVYTLLNVDRGVPEVFNSKLDDTQIGALLADSGLTPRR